MFLDSSTNNFLVTRNGNTTQGAFSPYGGGWSNYFDGNGDYLRTQLNAVNIRTAFTIESWVNLTTTTGFALFSASNTAGLQGTNLYLNIASGTIYLGDGLVDIVGFSASLIPLNSWSHIAVTFDGTTYRVFVNGTSVGSSTTQLSNNTLNGIDIGAKPTQSLFTTGYISNFRVVKGTALYTTAFTPPTAPLQPITGTALLTCADNRFIDDSPNNFAITRNGDVSVQKFNPFGIQTAMTPQTYSAYFDGSGDYLTLPSNQIQFTMGTGDFTIEMWVNVTSLASDRTLYDTLNQGDSTGTGRFAMLITTGGVVRLFTGSGQDITTGGTLVAGVWNHIAYSRQSSNGRLYVNGVQVNTTNTDSRNYVVGTSNRPIIGANGFDNSTGPMLGCISNLRVVKGTAVYTTNFTPSTTPLTAVAGTSLLTCQNATFIDNSTNNFAITATGNTQPLPTNPFGFTAGTITNYTPQVFGGSMYFDGTGDFVTAPANAAFQLTGDFTVEAWIYPTVVNSFNMVFGSENGANSDYLVIRPTTVELAVSNTAYPAWSQTFVANTWYHVAVTRQSNTLRAFVNGIQLTLSAGSATNSSQFFQSGAPIAVGRYGNPSPSYPFTGYISGARIIKSTAVYTSSFVPPAAPVTPVTNTTLLLNGTGASIYD
jgi:hypothetical protein